MKDEETKGLRANLQQVVSVSMTADMWADAVAVLIAVRLSMAVEENADKDVERSVVAIVAAIDDQVSTALGEPGMGGIDPLALGIVTRYSPTGPVS